jgi:hypothetical protein
MDVVIGEDLSCCWLLTVVLKPFLTRELEDRFDPRVRDEPVWRFSPATRSWAQRPGDTRVPHHSAETESAVMKDENDSNRIPLLLDLRRCVAGFADIRTGPPSQVGACGCHHRCLTPLPTSIFPAFMLRFGPFVLHYESERGSCRIIAPVGISICPHMADTSTLCPCCSCRSVSYPDYS